MPIPLVTHQFKDKFAKQRTDIKGKKFQLKSFKKHPCVLTIVRTYHCTQGGNYESIVLSLNSVLPVTDNIAKLTTTGLYVGFSRVHNFLQHRCLHLTQKERLALTKLKIDPFLKLYFENYDTEGNWIRGGSKKTWEKEKLEAKVDLAMCDLYSLVNKEMAEFCRRLDLHVEKKKTPYYLECLKEPHAQGKKLIQTNTKLLKERQQVWAKKLSEKNLKKMIKKDLRPWARKFNIYQSRRELDSKNIKELQTALQKIVRQYKKSINKKKDIEEKNIIIGNRNEQNTNRTGQIFYQTEWYTDEQLHYNNETKQKVKMLFGDNFTDRHRNKDTAREHFGGQAEVMGQYDQTCAFGIVTTFHHPCKKPDINTFKKILDFQFTRLKNLLLKGYDIIIPTPTQNFINENKKKFYLTGIQFIYHNLGTGIADLNFEYLWAIQEKINELKTCMNIDEITRIEYYNWDKILRTHLNFSDSNEETYEDEDIDLIVEHNYQENDDEDIDMKHPKVVEYNYQENDDEDIDMQHPKDCWCKKCKRNSKMEMDSSDEDY